MSWISGMIKELNSLRTKILSLPDDPDRSAPVPVVVEEEQVNYTDFRTHELKTMAKERGLKGYSKLNKRQLCQLLQEN